jgi:large subunit ribosomal protein L22
MAELSVKKKKTITVLLKSIRISPTKINLILEKIRKKSYSEAVNILNATNLGATDIIWAALHASVSNAIENHNLKKHKLYIYKAYANLGPILKRVQPRAKGRAFDIKKKYSHITLSVREEEAKISKRKN